MYSRRQTLTMKKLLAVPLLLLISVCAFGQAESDERAMLELHDGVTISKDSIFLLNIRFRMQNRVGFTTVSGEDLSTAAWEMRVRRLRLRFDGYALNKHWQYYIQLAFSKNDLDLEEGEVAQPIRDAIIHYRFNKWTQLSLGQSKLPGNRQRVISSGNQQFPDRSLANTRFTLDRDFGIFFYHTIPMNAMRWNVKTAVTSGDGRNASPIDEGLAYTGRLEWLPLGEFTKGGDFSEGDIEREPAPRLSLAGGYSTNRDARRVGGQLGKDLLAPRNMNTVTFDMVFKYKGWALSSEVMERTTEEDPVTTDMEGDVEYVYEGRGLNTQLSYCTPGRWEVAARYTFVDPSKRIAELTPRTEDAQLCCNKYLKGHRIKAQLVAGYRWLNGMMATDNPGNRWNAMFQLEFGI
jgi:phosphate-selective porin OprO and OprP